MALFVLVPGAGGMAWYWHRVVPLLGSAGHQAIAVDLRKNQVDIPDLPNTGTTFPTREALRPRSRVGRRPLVSDQCRRRSRSKRRSGQT
jgi:hypothetical protein